MRRVSFAALLGGVGRRKKRREIVESSHKKVPNEKFVCGLQRQMFVGKERRGLGNKESKCSKICISS